MGRKARSKQKMIITNIWKPINWKKNENSVTLTVKVDTLEPWEAMMSTSFPQALKIIKELSEQ